MTAAIPTLGYPTRTAAAVALRAKGLGNAEIGRRMGITAAQVSSLLISYERQASTAENRVSVVVPPETTRALDRAARKRGVTVNELVRRLLDAAASNDLTDAILDDLETST